MDVCLTNYGHCNYVSGKHACIFYDEVRGRDGWEGSFPSLRSFPSTGFWTQAEARMKGLSSFLLSILEGKTQCEGLGIPPWQPVCRSRLSLQLMLPTKTIGGRPP